VNHALTLSSAPTAKEITKLTRTFAPSGGIASTGNGTSKSTLRSVKTDHNQSAPKRTVQENNDYTKSESVFSKRLQEFHNHQHNTRNPFPFRHITNPGTPLVRNTKNPKLLKL